LFFIHINLQKVSPNIVYFLAGTLPDQASALMIDNNLKSTNNKVFSAAAARVSLVARRIGSQQANSLQYKQLEGYFA
jgi:hypothetical protein